MCGLGSTAKQRPRQLEVWTLAPGILATNSRPSFQEFKRLDTGGRTKPWVWPLPSVLPVRSEKFYPGTFSTGSRQRFQHRSTCILTLSPPALNRHFHYDRHFTSGVHFSRLRFRCCIDNEPSILSGATGFTLSIGQVRSVVQNNPEEARNALANFEPHNILADYQLEAEPTVRPR